MIFKRSEQLNFQLRNRFKWSRFAGPVHCCDEGSTVAADTLFAALLATASPKQQRQLCTVQLFRYDSKLLHGKRGWADFSHLSVQETSRAPFPLAIILSKSCQRGGLPKSHVFQRHSIHEFYRTAPPTSPRKSVGLDQRR